MSTLAAGKDPRDIGISRSGAYFAFRYGRDLPTPANTNRGGQSPKAA